MPCTLLKAQGSVLQQRPQTFVQSADKLSYYSHLETCNDIDIFIFTFEITQQPVRLEYIMYSSLGESSTEPA